jgi:tyramine---L-glutamate ligase
MNILVFEYVNGGGFCHTDLPARLAHEGSLMLNGLLADFAELPQHQIFVLLDARCVERIQSTRTANIHPIIINPEDDLLTVFSRTLTACDAAWLIAPETEHILFDYSLRVEQSNKRLLSCPSSAVAKTADKLQTFHRLIQHDILTIPTQPLNSSHFSAWSDFPLLIKPIDGAGCENSFVLCNQLELKQIAMRISQPERYIIQPFLQGETLSLCAIFNHPQAELVCINRQHLQIDQQALHLTGCEVNIAQENKARFQKVLDKLVHAFPDLSGYVGIDVLVNETAVFVVEINPRLTSSYVGIRQALGVNVAALVLSSDLQRTVIENVYNQCVFVDLT